MTTQEFINKLKAINLNDLDKDGNLINGKWKVKKSYEEDIRASEDMPSIRLVVHVYFDGQNVQSWGCVSEKSQREILKILLIAKEKAKNDKWIKEDQTRGVGKIMFKNLSIDGSDLY